MNKKEIQTKIIKILNTFENIHTCPAYGSKDYFILQNDLNELLLMRDEYKKKGILNE